MFTIPTLWVSDPLYTSRVAITTALEHPVYTTLSIPGSSMEIINNTISKGKSANITLPGDIRMIRGDGKQWKTIIVRASDNVSVFVIDNVWKHGDAFQARPSSKQGNEYCVASYRPCCATRPSFICISTIHPNTKVSISNHSELIHNVVLQKYESYRYDGIEYEDLSGYLVQSDKPVTVTSGGTPFIPEGVGNQDGVVDQLVSTRSWGTLYHIFPFQSLTTGFVYRVFASNTSTALHMSDGSVEYVQPGKFFEGNVEGNTVVTFQSEHPVLVVQFMKGYYSSTTYRGDPSMFVVPPVSSYTNNVTFHVLEYQTLHDYYINVVTDCEHINGLVFDDSTLVSSWDKLTTDDRSVCCVRSNVSTGYHSVTHINQMARFSVTVYAICFHRCGSSYAYSARGISALGK